MEIRNAFRERFTAGGSAVVAVATVPSSTHVGNTRYAVRATRTDEGGEPDSRGIDSLQVNRWDGERIRGGA